MVLFDSFLLVEPIDNFLLVIIHEGTDPFGEFINRRPTAAFGDLSFGDLGPELLDFVVLVLLVVLLVLHKLLEGA